jgi:hypothetical protein
MKVISPAAIAASPLAAALLKRFREWAQLQEQIHNSARKISATSYAGDVTLDSRYCLLDSATKKHKLY